MVAVGDLSSVTEEDVLNSAQISKRDYYQSLALIKQKTTIFYKRNPSETSVSPYNTVLLQLWQANMNIQFVTGIHGVVAYLTSYLCKAEAGMSELMKKACKDAAGTGAKQQLQAIGHVFRRHREVSQHEAIARTLSFHFRNSNVPVKYVPTGPKKNRTRMLKSKSALEAMDDADENIYSVNILDRYEKRPDDLEDMCLADFAANYEYNSKDAADETVRSYCNPVADYAADQVTAPGNATIIKLKDKLGSMRKRSTPCVLRWHSVSKLKNAEEYFLRLLQLYLPWRKEEDLLHHTGNYEAMFVEVSDRIGDKISEYERYEDLDFDDLQVVSRLYSDDEDNAADDAVLLAADPALLETDFQPDDPIPRDPNTAARVRDFLLPNPMYYDMCSKLNGKQREFFNYVLIHATKNKWLPTPEQPPPFFVFLSGGGGVGKSFLITIIAETLKRVLKHAGQTFEQPSICITASTGKAAVGIDGITLHSAFALPVTGSGQRRKISDERLQSMRLKYKYLQYLVVDEISMVGYYTFEDLDNHLQSIKENNDSFGGVSIIAGGDFFQLPPVKQSYVFAEPKGDAYQVLIGCLWKQLFYLHELTEIVRQAGDPHFAEILSRIREGLHDDADIKEIMALNDTDMSTWPAGACLKIYLTNDLAGRENTRCLNQLPAEKKMITAKDSTADLETGSCAVTVPEAWALNKTGNLCKKLLVAVGCRVMLTVNVDIEDRLINGSLGTVVRIELGSSPTSGTLFVKFDDDNAGNSKKNRRLPDELKDCVPVKAHVITFPMCNKQKTIRVQRKQFPLMLGHAITSHKSQGSTYEYMLASLDRTSKLGSRLTPVLPGQLYTMLSRAKCRTGIKLIKFHPKLVVTNKSALQEMKRMREERTLDCNIAIPEGSILQWNVRRAWHMHIPHLLSDEMYARCCDIMCFTETNVNDANNMPVFTEEWNELHVMSQHGLALCYAKQHVTVVKRYVVNPSLEALAVLLEHRGSNMVVLLLYRKPGPLLNFLACLEDQLRMLTEEMPSNCRLICIGDFNLDQRDPNNVRLLSAIQHTYRLQQRSRFTSHADGGILDLWLDTELQLGAVAWIPTPFSDHFILLST